MENDYHIEYFKFCFKSLNKSSHGLSIEFVKNICVFLYDYKNNLELKTFVLAQTQLSRGSSERVAKQFEK